MIEYCTFFEEEPGCTACFEALCDALMKRFPGTELLRQKTCLSFSDGRPYCYVSLPKGWNRKKNPERHIIVSFGLEMPVPDPRIWQAVRIRPDRWTHHVIVAAPEEIDDQLLAWLDWAHRMIE